MTGRDFQRGWYKHDFILSSGVSQKKFHYNQICQVNRTATGSSLQSKIGGGLFRFEECFMRKNQ
jgi:hypothetical protein